VLQLQYLVVWHAAHLEHSHYPTTLGAVAVCCIMLQYVAVCHGVLQCAKVCYSVLQCVAVCCSVMQCVTLCCNLLQCIAWRAAHLDHLHHHTTLTILWAQRLQRHSSDARSCV